MMVALNLEAELFQRVLSQSTLLIDAPGNKLIATTNI